MVPWSKRCRHDLALQCLRMPLVAPALLACVMIAIADTSTSCDTSDRRDGSANSIVTPKRRSPAILLDHLAARIDCDEHVCGIEQPRRRTGLLHLAPLMPLDKTGHIDGGPA